MRSWYKDSYLNNLIGRKKVDWSIFQHGTTIPKEFYEDFEKANNNHSLTIGERVDVDLIIEDKTFQAKLFYVPRKENNSGSLQIRYDENTALKDLLKETFSTTYQYLTENRQEKTKKPVYTPDDMAEYIDFYQTDKPYVYKVEFQPKGNPVSKPSFWWVNQGQTYRQEKDGGFLWAPQQSKQGRSINHHVRLLEANVGDVVFCYSSTQLKSVGIVKHTAVESPKPSAIANHDWQRDGYLLEVTYFELEPVIRKEEIPEVWRLEEGGPFDVNGNLKQGYFFQLSGEFANKLFQQFRQRFAPEVKTKMSAYEPKHENPEVHNPSQDYLSSKDVINHIDSYIKSKGFYYPKEEIINLFLALKTKPFVILSGISGTGKTKIIQWFAESVGATEENGQFELIPIRPDWNDGSDLLGYVDIKGDFKMGPLTKVIKRAVGNPDLPYFVLLDEMNLARVEYYFSDILSVMESRKWQNGKVVSSKLLTEEVAGEDLILS